MGTVLVPEAEVQPIAGIEAEVDSRVEALGFEVVEVEWGGTSRKPMLRVRVDLPDSTPGQGVTVEDCARLSRAIEERLDTDPAIPDRYVLEVSSPGVERPLSRRRDFVRFVGQQIAIKRRDTRDAKRLPGRVTGVLERVEGEGDDYRVMIRTADGAKIVVPRKDIVKANLVFSWHGDA